MDLPDVSNVISPKNVVDPKHLLAHVKRLMMFHNIGERNIKLRNPAGPRDYDVPVEITLRRIGSKDLILFEVTEVTVRPSRLPSRHLVKSVGAAVHKKHHHKRRKKRKPKSLHSQSLDLDS